MVNLVIQFAKDVRIRHPRMGARKIYLLMAKSESCQHWFEYIGRDKVEAILLNNGFAVRKIKNYHKTTRSGSYRVGNLIKELIINKLNQVWVSDITYYFVVESGKIVHYYITFILDLYSRRIIGYAVSDNMTAEATVLAALKVALKTRNVSKKDQLQGLIFHSDGGGQYIDALFLQKIKFYGARSSMAKDVYENPNAEKINDTIKNDYLIPWGVNSKQQLDSHTPKAIEYYNNEKPHDALNKRTPLEFEMTL
jgi:transposase InsO family protein